MTIAVSTQIQCRGTVDASNDKGSASQRGLMGTRFARPGHWLGWSLKETAKQGSDFKNEEDCSRTGQGIVFTQIAHFVILC